MSAHYLIDMFGPVVSNLKIVDVRYPANGQSALNGQFVLRVPDGVSILTPPTSLSDLITKKHAGLLAYYAGFTRIVYDDLLNTADVDPLNSLGISPNGPNPPSLPMGERASPALNPKPAWSLTPTGVLQTVMIPLVGPAPAYVVPTWELWEAVDTDPATARFIRTYSELPATSTYITGEVSFDNGVTWTPATSGAVVFIPPASQGLSFILKLSNPHASKRVRVGSWALIY